MSSTSNVPAIVISSTGASVPQTSDVLNGVLEDLNTAFGGNLNITNVATPQGYLAENLTSYIQTANSAIVYLLNQIDPAYAEGRWQDAIGRLYFMTRNPATATVVTCQLIGQPGAVLPAGAVATDGVYLYSSLGTVSFNLSGTATVDFECSTLGAITCAANTLNKIAQVYPGWDAVNNPSAGVVGSDSENRVDFEYRRQQSVAENARDSLSSVRGTVFDVTNVLDVYAYENSTNSAVSVGATSYSVPAHSMYVAVVGGTDAEVAKAIWTKKPLGCGMSGNTNVTVYDTEAPSFPYPSYTITFERPIALPIYFVVNIGNYPNLPSDIVAQVKSAIIASFNGQDGGSRARIAADIYASRFYSNVTAISSTVRLISILIGTSASPTGSEVAVGIDRVPTTDTAHIVVNLI